MLLQSGRRLRGLVCCESRAAVTAGGLPDLNGAPVLISAGQTDHLIPASDAEVLGNF